MILFFSSVLVDASECLRTEEPFKINRWKLPVTKPKLDIIAKGRYTKYVEVGIDPTWPSSSTYRQGFVKYAIIVRYKANGRMNERVAHSEEQEIWVLNSENVPAGGPPTVVTGLAQHESLHVQASIPSAVVVMGQLVPVTVQLSPNVVANKYAGRKAVVLGATYKVKQKHRVRCRGFHVGEGVVAYDNCLKFALNDGWPKDKDRWERTVDIRIPSDPVISAYTITKFLFITHTLTVKLIFQTSSGKDLKISKTEECKLTCTYCLACVCLSNRFFFFLFLSPTMLTIKNNQKKSFLIVDIKVVPPPPSTDAVVTHELPPGYEPSATQPPEY